jgi:hypothetical protein
MALVKAPHDWWCRGDLLLDEGVAITLLNVWVTSQEMFFSMYSAETGHSLAFEGRGNDSRST